MFEKKTSFLTGSKIKYHLTSDKVKITLCSGSRGIKQHKITIHFNLVWAEY